MEDASRAEEAQVSPSSTEIAERELLDERRPIAIEVQRLKRLLGLAHAHCMARCESPIEERLLRRLIEPTTNRFRLFDGNHDAVAGIRDHVDLFAQHSVTAGDGKLYRLDFAAVGIGESAAVRIAIECDGHNFHERTKEQAAHDKSRDRALTLAGWMVLRFTGSEIHRDADACAAQVMIAIRRLAAPGVV